MKSSTNYRINKVETTNETLSSRGGLALFVKYLENIGIYSLIIEAISFIRIRNRGSDLKNIMKQIFCFFADGTSRHLNYFEELKQNEGYSAVLENAPEQMISSHTVKRFLKKFLFSHQWLWRKVLRELFIWRLKEAKSPVVELTIDTMVMDNDEALKREGVKPTYKKVKGYQPLQVIWERKIIDAIFRSGDKHSNYSDHVEKTIKQLVKLIRNRYKKDVVIVIKLDGGFFDEKLFQLMDQLDVKFVASAKKYEWVKQQLPSTTNSTEWSVYEKDKRTAWKYTKLDYQCKKWEKGYRGIYTQLLREDQQELFEFAQTDNIIITNIGSERVATEKESQSKKEENYILTDEELIQLHHSRGADELPHRGLKEFGSEQLPFHGFTANMAWYYLMVISFFLFETFKEDVLSEIISIKSYATKVRRKIFDIAGKIVRGGNEIKLKVSAATMKMLQLEKLWERSHHPPPIEMY